MLSLIPPRRAEAILRRCGAWIDTVSRRYQIPGAVIRAILYQEMTTIDLLDPAADLAVQLGLFSRQDSSTGYGQIFGRTGLRAINFAADRGLTDYASLGLVCDHRLDENDKRDLRLVWNLLHSNWRANIEISALNLLCAAEEMTGRIDFAHYTDGELKLILTRYNANVRHVTAYGEAAFAHYLRYRAEEKA